MKIGITGIMVSRYHWYHGIIGITIDILAKKGAPNKDAPFVYRASVFYRVNVLYRIFRLNY